MRELQCFVGGFKFLGIGVIGRSGFLVLSGLSVFPSLFGKFLGLLKGFFRLFGHLLGFLRGLGKIIRDFLGLIGKFLCGLSNLFKGRVGVDDFPNFLGGRFQLILSFLGKWDVIGSLLNGLAFRKFDRFFAQLLKLLGKGLVLEFLSGFRYLRCSVLRTIRNLLQGLRGRLISEPLLMPGGAGQILGRFDQILSKFDLLILSLGQCVELRFRFLFKLRETIGNLLGLLSQLLRFLCSLFRFLLGPLGVFVGVCKLRWAQLGPFLGKGRFGLLLFGGDLSFLGELLRLVRFLVQVLSFGLRLFCFAHLFCSQFLSFVCFKFGFFDGLLSFRIIWFLGCILFLLLKVAQRLGGLRPRVKGFLNFLDRIVIRLLGFLLSDFRFLRKFLGRLPCFPSLLFRFLRLAFGFFWSELGNFLRHFRRDL